MKCIVWNARGLGSTRAFRYLQRLIADFPPDLLFVSESKIPSSVRDIWRSLFNFDCFFGVDLCGRSGGLFLFWMNKINLSLGSFSSVHIDCRISDPSFAWHFTGYYGNLDHNLRPTSWDLLRKLSSLYESDGVGWLVDDDFN
ncbi:hypothetical protein ACS0TY_011661 [Phlomoides rotata]